MAAVTSNQMIKARNPGDSIPVPISASTTLYAGQLVFADATTGYAIADVAAVGDRLMGVCKYEYDNSSGSDGDVIAEVYSTGLFTLPYSSATQGLNGDPVNAAVGENHLVTTGAGAPVGRIENFVSTTEVEVRLGRDTP